MISPDYAGGRLLSRRGRVVIKPTQLDSQATQREAQREATDDVGKQT